MECGNRRLLREPEQPKVPGTDRPEEEGQSDEMDAFRDRPRPVHLHQCVDPREAIQCRFQLHLEWNQWHTDSTVRRVHVYASRRPAAMAPAQVTSDTAASILVVGRGICAVLVRRSNVRRTTRAA